MDIEGHSHRLMLYVRWLFIGIGNSSCNVEKCLLLWIVFIGIGNGSCNVEKCLLLWIVEKMTVVGIFE